MVPFRTSQRNLNFVVKFDFCKNLDENAMVTSLKLYFITIMTNIDIA